MKEKKKKGSVVTTIVFIVALICCAYAAIQLIRIALSYHEGTNTYETIAQQVKIEPQTAQSEGAEEVQIDFDALKKINEDIIGWIRFDSIDISYPILHGVDNQEYLYTMADGTANNAGSIFLEALNAPDFNDLHTIIYGHNMKNKSMFGLLKNYISEEGYYEENRYFTIYTPEMAYRYEIFAYYDVAEDDEIYQVGFIADEIFADFVDTMKERSYADAQVEVTGEDKIVTLSTCSTEGRRTIVNAVRVEETKIE